MITWSRRRTRAESPELAPRYRLTAWRSRYTYAVTEMVIFDATSGVVVLLRGVPVRKDGTLSSRREHYIPGRYRDLVPV